MERCMAGGGPAIPTAEVPLHKFKGVTLLLMLVFESYNLYVQADFRDTVDSVLDCRDKANIAIK